MIGFRDDKWLAVDIPDDLRAGRSLREFERQPVQRGGLIGVAPDVGVVFWRSDGEDRPGGRFHLLPGA